MEITINGNVSIGTKVDVASGATFINHKIDKIEHFYSSQQLLYRGDSSVPIDDVLAHAGVECIVDDCQQSPSDTAKEEQPVVTGKADGEMHQIPDRFKMTDMLTPYFNIKFRGRNSTKTDYLPILARDICGYQVHRDLARIANMLYNSKEMINKPRSFAAWYRTFCIICGCKAKKYVQSQVDDYDFLKSRFYYLSF